MSIATGTGDAGTTGLMFGRRVSKTDARVEAYGTIDELNAALGFARSLTRETLIAEPVSGIQKELVTLMGELAVADEDLERYVKGGKDLVSAAMVDGLGLLVVDLEKNHKISFSHWATPGATPAAGAFDVARTVCRRAERRVVEVREKNGKVNPEIIRYLNRLSDLCWLYARWLETKNGGTAA
jgi:cob(I)alamin adenosyltransferase